MIIIVETDIRRHNGKRFSWSPGWFTGRWGDKKTWRVWWGFWSVSYYPSPGLKDFFDYGRSGETEWQSKTL